ncbi:MAG: histidine kinase [Prolixibacteraceae bacterium]|nr:histidine kinase [Prolixibacteraceae bacterium]MBN2775502.1 histidine kinase [Prolixibacteraceae bacterium]
MSAFLFSKKYKFRLARHLAFFCFTVFVFALILYLRGSEIKPAEILITVFLNALFFFGYAYITIFLIIPEFILKNRLLSGTLIFLLIGIGLSSIKLLSSNEIFYSSLSPENIEHTGFFNLRFIIVNTKDMSFIVAIFCIVKYAKDYLYDDKIRRELEERNKEAQNKLLQSQFDPHFLFNTINNLYALSLLDPGKTNRLILRFKSVLEYITEKSQKKYVAINDEMDLLENYIQLEKLRYGNRLNVEINKKGDFSGELVPPMVFFVLAENCFEHGSSLDAGNPWIKINLKKDNGFTVFTTENSKPENGNAGRHRGEGISLLNLHKRLNLLYLNNYSLKVEDKKNRFFVELKVKR